MRRLVLGLLAALAALGGALAQTPPGDERLQRAPYVTSTGETVDKPGVPQASGPTKLDRKIQRQDNKIDQGVCKGC